ncbi:hypothetical protein [Streptomyces sp. NPDC029704]|uniref:hypothetical protein n=1 Tax=Streptomyces sp. NPDC029704 TaxID=3156920 RepID=UPI003404890F
MGYEEYTAAELADALVYVGRGSPEDTGTLSLLDQATLRWSMRHPELKDAHEAFAQARQAQWPRTRSEETWQTVVIRANELAAGLRELGDAVLVLCAEQGEWGTCRRPLGEDGQCPHAAQHLPAQHRS